MNLLAVVMLCTTISADADNGYSALAGTPATHAPGPDVIVLNIPHVLRLASTNGFTAFGVGTTACNLGDVPANWINDASPLGNQHPVVAQNIYRLHAGRFEQLGLSWLKHGFCALNDPGCGECQSTPCESLGVHCADTYAGFQNGIQEALGPRSVVNAATGEFPHPHTAPLYGGDLERRLLVANTDLDLTLFPGARFFAEGHYVLPDDAAAGNDDNNASYRRFVPTLAGAGGWHASVVDDTVTEQPAVAAWAAEDPAVTLVNLDIPGDGRVVVASRAVATAGGLWDYEYAVYNLNSDRSIASISIPVPAGVLVSSTGFHDVTHHSGEPYDATDWPATHSACALAWATAPYDVNPNANAVRWATLYNFRFAAAAPPGPAAATLGLFKPGTPATWTAAVTAPSVDCPAATADCTSRDLADFAALQACMGVPGPAGPPCPAFDLDCDGDLDLTDLAAFTATLTGPLPPAP